MPRRLDLVVAIALLSACGGAAESAEEPEGTGVPMVEAEAAPEAVTPDVASPPAATPTAPAATPAQKPASRPAEPATPPVEEPVTPTVEEPAEEGYSIAEGTALALTLDQELSTRSSKAGDAFSAHLTADLLGPDGEVILPAGAAVRGRVAESMESPASDVPAVLRLEIVDMMVDGVAIPVLVDVEEVQLEAEAKDSDRLTAGKVAVGAAAGALLGKIAGKGKTKGAVAGAAAGAAVAIATRDGHAKIPAGATMIVRVVEAVVIR